MWGKQIVFANEGLMTLASVRVVGYLLHLNPETNKPACFDNRLIVDILTEIIVKDDRLIISSK